MAQIQDYCWQGFSPVEVERCTIATLEQVTLEREPSPFVVFDRQVRWSSLIFPLAVHEIVGSLDLPRETAIATIGVTDLLRQRQIIVPGDAPAVPVLHLAVKYRLDAILSVDDAGEPRGLLIPTNFAERLPSASIVKEHVPAIAAPTLTVPLDDAILNLDRVVNQLQPGHVSEQLNYATPDPYICSGDGCPHACSRCPCDEHENSTCQRESIATG